MDKLIVGLGNPGKEYENTRHNIGQMALSYMSFSAQLRWTKKFKGQFAQHSIGDDKVYVLFPETYMNLSGESVQPAMAFFKVEPENLLVVQDELDLPFGTIAFKYGGGLAGHNGLKSIAGSLGTQDFCRLRIGIDKPAVGTVSDWVLNKFQGDEKMFIDDYLKGAAEIMEFFLANPKEKCVAKFGKKNFPFKKA